MSADNKRICQTPEAHYRIHVKPDRVSVEVTNLPAGHLNEDDAVLLSDRIHDALEDVLRDLYPEA